MTKKINSKKNSYIIISIILIILCIITFLFFKNRFSNNEISNANKENQSWFFLDSNNQTQTTNASNKSKYAWLFDYTKECTNFGCNTSDYTVGYWTSTPYRTYSGYAWVIDCDGKLYLQDITNNADYGVRPVITVSKADI